MNLEAIISDSVEKKGIATMCHIVCGYPSFEDNEKILDVMDENGVEFVEFQFPFSEPIADGPLFLKANQASIDAGTTTEDCLQFLAKCAAKYNFKPVMMGYYNTIFNFGESLFCQRLKEAGACALIIPDLPIEEAQSLRDECVKQDLNLVPLVAPTNTVDRLKEVLDLGQGFIYAVARKGVTGKKTEFSLNLEGYLGNIKSISNLPLAVGFGVSGKSDLDYLKGKAHMAVIGTAVLKTYLESGQEGLKNFFKSIFS